MNSKADTPSGLGRRDREEEREREWGQEEIIAYKLTNNISFPSDFGSLTTKPSRVMAGREGE